MTDENSIFVLFLNIFELSKSEKYMSWLEQCLSKNVEHVVVRQTVQLWKDYYYKGLTCPQNRVPKYGSGRLTYYSIGYMQPAWTI